MAENMGTFRKPTHLLKCWTCGRLKCFHYLTQESCVSAEYFHTEIQSFSADWFDMDSRCQGWFGSPLLSTSFCYGSSYFMAIFVWTLYRFGARRCAHWLQCVGGWTDLSWTYATFCTCSSYSVMIHTIPARRTQTIHFTERSSFKLYSLRHKFHTETQTRIPRLD